MKSSKWIRGGLDTQRTEMCYAFMYYYPRLEDISFCSSMTPLEVSQTLQLKPHKNDGYIYVGDGLHLLKIKNEFYNSKNDYGP